MTPEKHRAHALLARTLIRACGGLVEAASACRLEKSRLQEFCDPARQALMPMDVIDALQDYESGGRRMLYYEGLAAMLPYLEAAASLQEECCSLTEAVASLQAYVRLHKGGFSTHQKHEIELKVQEAEGLMRCFRHAAERGAS